MPVYVYESNEGAQIERLFPASSFPREVVECGVVYRKVLSGISISIPERMTAAYDDTSRFYHENFNAPKKELGGKSYHDLVKEGSATTADMSRWV